MNNRQKIIISYLLDNKDNINIESLSKQFNISTRSIYNDINKIKSYLIDFDIAVEIDQSKNFYLTGKVTNFNPSLLFDTEKFSSEQRHIEIFIRFFLKGEIISYTELSEEWYVSRTTIYGDINHFKDEIKPYNISIKNNSTGSFVIGEEENIQEYSIEKIKKALELPTVKAINDFETRLKTFFLDKHVNDIKFLLDKINEKLDKKMRDSYFANLLVSLLVLITRKDNGFSLNKKDGFITLKNDSMMLYGFTLNFVDRLTERTNISFNDPEIDRISSLFYAHGIEPKLTAQSISPEIEMIVDESIEYMSEVMLVDYSSDSLLRSSLLFHFEPMVHRLQMNIKISNPLLKELKKQYSIIFNATWYVYSTLMNKLGLSITEEEVSYLMVHFQASIERNLPSSRVLFISPIGIGISELAINRLKNILPRYVSVEHTSELKPKSEDIKEFDLVISTVNLEIKNQAIVQVSPLIDEADKTKILKYYTDIDNNSLINKDNYHFKHLKRLVDIENIYINEKFDNKSEAIEFVVNQFYDRNYVTDDCLKSVLEREEMGDTALANGTAIPHSNMETVNESKIAIVTFDKGINWGQTDIKVMFLICISPTDYHIVKNILVDIENIVESKEIVKKLTSIKNRDDMYKFLFDGKNNEGG